MSARWDSISKRRLNVNVRTKCRSFGIHKSKYVPTKMLCYFISAASDDFVDSAPINEQLFMQDLDTEIDKEMEKCNLFDEQAVN